LIRLLQSRFALLVGASLVIGAVQSAHAQVTPAAGYAPTDDTPSVKVGGLIFTDYTFQQLPKGKDAPVQANFFNVSRSYVNVTGNISHIVGFRITPDVSRATDSSLNGSLVFRLKYAFAQLSLEDWLPKGTWVRMGIQQTPFVDYFEGIYRYRFQGTVFPERQGYISSADAGLSFHTAFPTNYGDLHVGVYNGENYNKVEANDRKAIQGRVTFRPFPWNPMLRGWRLTGFYIADDYQAKAEKKRLILDTTYEHKYVNLGFDYLDTKDQASPVDGSHDLHGKGWSAWATPKYAMANGSSIEALLRYDHMEPKSEDTTVGPGGATVDGKGTDKRLIGGLAYWFPHTGNVSAGLMLDVDNAQFSDYTPSKPTLQTVALHGVISF
jgi:hypothetical protein